MKLLIAGSRDILIDSNELDTIIKENFDINDIKEVVSGNAKGIDKMGYRK